MCNPTPRKTLLMLNTVGIVGFVGLEIREVKAF
jgi:hypothetical protein